MEKINLIEPVYNVEVPVLYNGCPAQMNDYLFNHYGIEQDVVDNGTAGQMIELTGDDVKMFLVWMEQFKNDPYYISILCHEMNHLTLAILRDVGIEMCSQSEEAFTYLQGYYIKTFLTKFNKRMDLRAAKEKKKKQEERRLKLENKRTQV